MTYSYWLIILSLINPLHFISIQASKEQLSFLNHNNDVQQRILHASTPLRHTENNEVTTNLRSWKGQIFSHRRHHVRNAHGILNMIGWGTLLPIGVIIARFFRKFPVEYGEWYTLHVLCQTSGYIIGTIGWAVGLWLGNSSKHYTLKTHRILGILIFTLATIQILVAFVQPKREDECRKCWEIFHQCLGYTVIALIVANIFQGIIHQSHAEKWKWIYVGILAVLGFVAATLEIFRWIFKSRIQQQMPTFHDSNIHNFT
ncbi:Cytochrome b561 and DOMON domain-containing protein [Melia azedarach]|uniref:Cytochrome b561 and DOMON domain-containing protein n=1 Tax=Melia azedarach TaxID=155640 RepID=A0ACC1WXK6_MELAZ|nr:Cytochrome b561 and DOMON domain-containing protein [Melia azedarach]